MTKTTKPNYRDTTWKAVEMGSEGWSVFAGPHLIASNLTEQHARLIEQAPNLLEALKGARGVLYSASCYLGTSFRDSAKYWQEKADEAIRKTEVIK